MDLTADDLREVTRDVLAPAVALLMDLIDAGDERAVREVAEQVEQTAQAIRYARVV